MCFSFIFLLRGQNPEFIGAEKFEYHSSFLEFGLINANEPTMICNHEVDLSYFNSDYDPMGVRAASVLRYENEAFFHTVSFRGETDIRFLDAINNGNLMFMFETEGPLSFEDNEGNVISIIDLPQLENMTGIVHFIENDFNESIETSYIIAPSSGFQKLWQIEPGLTLITGRFEETLKYVNPDESEVDLVGESKYNIYAIAIDANGYYQWSYIDGVGGGINDITGVVVLNDEIILGHNTNTSRDSRIIHINLQGEETREIIDWEGIWIRDMDKDDNDNLIVSADYSLVPFGTNIDLNGSEYILDPPNAWDGFLVKYDKNKNVSWVKYVTGEGPTSNLTIDLANDAIFLSGAFDEDIILDPNGPNEIEMTGFDRYDAFVAKYQSDGSLVWAITYGSDYNDDGQNIKIYENQIYVFGGFGGLMDVDPDPNEEIFLDIDDPFEVRAQYILVSNDNGPNSTHSTNVDLSRAFPNPATTYIELPNRNERIVRINDLMGQEIKHYYSNKIDISSLNNGAYILTSQREDGSFVTQIVNIIH